MEQRIKDLERQVKRLQRKKSGKMIAVLTPYPISNCVKGEDVSGAVLKYMFPAVGKITKGMIRLATQLKSGANIHIYIANDIGSESKSYPMPRRNLLVELDFDVYSGDRLIVYIESENPEEKITEVWTSFLWTPNIKESTLKHFLISELEKEVEDEESS